MIANDDGVKKILAHPAFKRVNAGLLQSINLSPAHRNGLISALATGRAISASYRTLVKPEEIEDLKATVAELRAAFEGWGDETFASWLDYKDQEAGLLEAIVSVQAGGPADKLRVANRKLYGEINAGVFYSQLSILAGRAEKSGKDGLVLNELNEILAPILDGRQGGVGPAAGIPSDGQFKRYQSYARQLFEKPIAAVEAASQAHSLDISAENVESALAATLRASGAEDWRVVRMDGPEKISINPISKTIRISNRGLHMSRDRFTGLALHEICVHVARKSLKPGFGSVAPVISSDSLRHEEGLGTLVEQLMLRSFVPLRLFRFLAVGLAAGIDGTERDIAAVYELLWRLRYLTSGTSLEQARYYAASESIRAYRGIAPSVPGAVIYRDKLYLEGNLAIWQRLMESDLEYQEFVNLLRH